MHAHSHKGGEHDVSAMPMKEVVSKHGPATHLFTQHDHEEGSHHVHSVHGEKHHHSDHDSADAAHDQMGAALGMGGADEEAAEGETPDEGAEASSAPAPASSSRPAFMS